MSLSNTTRSSLGYAEGKTLYRKDISVSTSGDHVIVQAVEGKAIAVYQLMLVPDVDNQKILFKSGSTNLTGRMNLSIAGNGFVVAATLEDYHWLQTNEGEGLTLNLSTNGVVGGIVVYTLI